MKNKFFRAWRLVASCFVFMASGVAYASDIEYDANGFSDSEAYPYQSAIFDEETQTYLISNAGQLYWYAQGVNKGNVKKGAKLTANIVVNADVIVDGQLNPSTEGFRAWQPIGSSSFEMSYNFDGDGHSISGLYCKDTQYAALIGFVSGDNVEIKNVTVRDSYFSNSNTVAGIVARKGDGSLTISNCHFYGLVEASQGMCGAILGWVPTGQATIDNCSNRGTIRSTDRFCGGIVGTASSSINITDSYNATEGRVENTKNYTGGIVGGTSSTATLIGCHNDGYVTGQSRVSGVIGYVEGGEATVKQCYNAGEVNSQSGYSAGIVGSVESNATATILNCYHSGVISGYVYNVSGLVANISYRGSCSIDNCFVTGEVVKDRYSSYPRVYYYYSDGTCNLTNAYSDMKDDFNRGTQLTNEQISNGILAYILRKGTEGTVWGQNVGTDSHPTFSGELLNADITEYSIAFTTYDGDEAASSYPSSYIIGIAVTLPTTSRTGYTFLGWYDNADFEGEAVTTIPADATGDKAFYAKFAIEYNITYHDGFSGTTSDTYTSTVEKELGRITHDGYIFNGWYTDEELTNGPVAIIGAEETGDKTFYAKWFEIAIPQADEQGTYLISNAAELYGFSAIVNGTHGQTKNVYANARLTADITVNEGVLDKDVNGVLVPDKFFMEWDPIGKYENYKAMFDGDGHTISGLYYNGDGHAALIGYLYNYDRTYPVGVKDLTIADSYFKTTGYSYYAASVCAYAYYDIVLSNLTSYAQVVSSNNYAAGIVAYYSYPSTSSIDGCVNYGKIEGGGNAGGICGYFYASSDQTLGVKNSTNHGEVSGKSAVGGILGYGYCNVTDCANYGAVNVEQNNYTGGIAGYVCSAYNCHNYGSVTTNGSNVGGVIGYVDSNSTTHVTLCSNHGDVVTGNNTYYVGGVVGYMSVYYETAISQCYNVGSVSSQKTSGYVGGVAAYISEKVSMVDCYNAGSISGAIIGGLAGHSDVLLSNIFNTGKLQQISTTQESYISCKGSLVGESEKNEDESFKCSFVNAYNNSHFSSLEALQSTAIEGVDLNTIALCNGTLPAGFSEDVWTAGSIVTDAETNTVTFNFPYITALGEKSQFSLTATYVVDGYTSEYNYGDEFIYDGTVTFTIDDDVEFGADINSSDVSVTAPVFDGSSVVVEALYQGAVQFSYTVNVNGVPTAISNIDADKAVKGDKAYKTVENGRVVIIRGSEKYSLSGSKM
ncbi:MAG: InlB B-repeat-containing protein [Bacteroidales bacterium]|nr:InlB B-repeat-containing protein [Bacteroidales bacterium]